MQEITEVVIEYNRKGNKEAYMELYLFNILWFLGTIATNN